MVYLGPLDDTNSLGNENHFIDGWKLAHEKEQVFETNLNLRINYIISKIFEIYDKKYDNRGFYFTEKMESELDCYECGGKEINVFNYICWKYMGGLNNLLIFYNTINYHSKNFPAIYKDKFINLGDKFPYKWLFSDFEEDLKCLKQTYIDFNLKRDAEKLAKKQARLVSKDEKIRLKEKLKSKLTPEELAIISFKK